MTSYLRKYVTALASAKDYIAQWSSDHVFADEGFIVPFPTLAIFDPNKHIWSVHIKAWIYLPFQNKSLTSYLPSLPSFLSGNKNSEKENEENIDESNKNSDTENKEKKTIFNENDPNKINNQSQSTSNDKVDKDKKETAAIANKEDHKEKKKDGSSDEGSNSDDDFYEECLR